MAGKTLVILGGGVGGLVAAHELRRRLGPEHRIVVVEREADHRFQASYPWVMMGWREPAQISRPLRSLNQRGIDSRRATVLGIDPQTGTVDTDSGPIAFDYLVLALGAELADDAIPGLAEAGYTPYTVDGAIKLREAWQSFERGSVAVVISSLPFKCPAAPYEVAMLLESGFRRRGVRDSVDVQFYTPEALPMPVAGSAVGQALKGMLEEKHIGFNPSRKLSSVDPGKRVLTFEDKTSVGFDLLVYIPPHRSPGPVRASAVAGEAGWVPVNGRTLETTHEGVYAIGDVAAIKLPNGMMLPKAGVFAHGEAEVVAHRIADDIEGAGADATFDGWGSCFVETGDRNAAYGSGSFYAEPNPAVRLYMPTKSRHVGRVAFEKTWLTAISGPLLISCSAFRAVGLLSRRLLEQHWLWSRL